MATHHSKDKILTSDGIHLAYQQFGDPSNPNVVLLHGWNQSAALWRSQYNDAQLASDFHITAYDHRGHGESEKATHGFRTPRLAADLNDLLLGLALKDVTLVCHSMGCAVVWMFWDLYPAARSNIKKLVLVDQAPVMMPRPFWTQQDIEKHGHPSLDDAMFNDFVSAWQKPETHRQTVEYFVGSMHTSRASKEQLAFSLEQNTIMDPTNAIVLFCDFARLDFRDVLPRIDVPTLVVGGEASKQFSIASSKYSASKIPRSQLVVFSEEQGGSHCLIAEGADRFNRILEDFLNTGKVEA